MLKPVIMRSFERGELGRAVMLGLNFGVGMAVFTFIGYYIDTRRGGGAIFFTVSGMVAGLAYGAYEVWMVIRMLNAQARRALEAGYKPPPPDEDDAD